MNRCTIEGCTNKLKSAGMCHKHWLHAKPERFQKHAEYQRRKRKETNFKYQLTYMKTKKGFLVYKYHGILQRVSGKYKGLKPHIYKGLPVMPRQEFYDWALSDESFNALWDDYVASNYKMSLCPSPDRLNSLKGYTLDNMEWVTHSENSRRSHL